MGEIAQYSVSLQDDGKSCRKPHGGGYDVKRIILLATACILGLWLSGCATIVTRSSREIVIRSNPNQAAVLITNSDGEQVFKGTTPTSVVLKTRKGYFKGWEYVIRLSKPGYQDRHVLIEKSCKAWYLYGNIVFLNVIGWFVVDPLTGAMWTLKPDTVEAVLPPMTTLVPGAGPGAGIGG